MDFYDWLNTDCIEIDGNDDYENNDGYRIWEIGWGISLYLYHDRRGVFNACYLEDENGHGIGDEKCSKYYMTK